MINEYIDCTEFMRLIEDQKIKPSVVKRYLKEQGMVFTSTNARVGSKCIYYFSGLPGNGSPETGYNA